MDEFGRPYWNLCQVNGWVLTRDPDVVRDWADSTLSVAELRLSLRNTSEGTSYFENTAEAEREIISKLAGGHIEAIGLENGAGDPTPIPRIFWANAKFYYHPDLAASEDGVQKGGTQWNNFRFDRVYVVMNWPHLSQAIPISPFELPEIGCPLEKPWWTLCEVVTWIAFRSPMNSSRERTHNGAPSALGISKDEFEQKIADAEDQLLLNLRGGKFAIEGHRGDFLIESGREEIPGIDLRTKGIKLRSFGDEIGPISERVYEEDGIPIWHGVELESSGLLTAFPISTVPTKTGISPKKRGVKKGQGAIDDSRLLNRIKGGEELNEVAMDEATNDKGEVNQKKLDAVKKRLNRKLKDTDKQN